MWNCRLSTPFSVVVAFAAISFGKGLKAISTDSIRSKKTNVSSKQLVNYTLKKDCKSQPNLNGFNLDRMEYFCFSLKGMLG